MQHLGGYFTHGECVALVAVVAVKLDDAVKANDVALAQGIVGRKSVNDYLIDLDTERTGETAITETSGTTAIVLNEFTGNGVKLERSDARSHPLSDFAKCATHEVTCLSHQSYFFRCFKIDHYILKQ